ncbi:MAG TPA: rhomboid family intramembrane serine protease [Solirubrobacteraceae bacterium]|nr:rhomboid family intramembrane serine protease [Solirubrobacteraceae bacterium]
MASGPELFVVCKNCRSQVSPYITECPYCGQRLRKRAPKIEREGAPPKGKAKSERRRKPPKPGLGPLRTGEIPGIRGDETRKPWATIVLVAIGALWWLAAIPLEDEAIRWILDPLGEWWGVILAPFLNAGGWYQFAALGSLGLFGWLLERRHGPVVVVLVWLLAASGGMAVVKALEGDAYAIGASGGALGMLCAWAVPVLLARRRRGDDDDDADMIGVAVLFALLALMPLARDEVSALATGAGIVIGALCGLLLARLAPRD